MYTTHLVHTYVRTYMPWFSPQAVEVIDRGLVNAQESISDLDLYVMEHSQFGKGVIKKYSISPDAFIQLALQLAYYRVSVCVCVCV